LVEFYDTL